LWLIQKIIRYISNIRFQCHVSSFHISWPTY
jgi:hypothetical protein